MSDADLALVCEVSAVAGAVLDTLSSASGAQPPGTTNFSNDDLGGGDSALTASSKVVCSSPGVGGCKLILIFDTSLSFFSRSSGGGRDPATCDDTALAVASPASNSLAVMTSSSLSSLL